MKKQIDHDLTDEVVCPHCGHESGCSHEFFEGGKDAATIEKGTP